MPSKSFGDFHLKYAEFNFHNRNIELGFRPSIRQFTGPYITHRPDIREFDLTSNDVFLILASDGLWDHLPKESVPKIVQENCESNKAVALSLLNECLNIATKERGVTREYLSHMQPGKHKRNFVDDITILVVNLAHQVN